MERQYSIDALAEITGKSRGALAQMRYTGTGPRFIKFGRSVLYPESGITEYFAANTRTRTRSAAHVGR